MDEDIEDIVGDIKWTDSQKSVATSNVYSMDFTECSSENNNSSGKATYVIDLDTSENSERNFPMQEITSPINFNDNGDVKKSMIPVNSNCDMNTENKITKRVSRAVSTSSNKCLYFALETSTQTSKTIIELAGVDLGKKTDTQTLETQTSSISIIENKITEYRIELNNQKLCDFKNIICEQTGNFLPLTADQPFNSSLGDGSSKLLVSETENEDDSTSYGSSEKIINILDVNSKEIGISDEQNYVQYANPSYCETTNTDIEEDSLSEPPRYKVNAETLSDVSEVPISIDNDIEELYTKISDSIDAYSLEVPIEADKRILSPLTTLTEESALLESSQNVATNIKLAPDYIDKDIIFTNTEGLKVKLLPNDAIMTQQLPELTSIRNRSYQNSPQLNYLFSVTPTVVRPLTKSGVLPLAIEGNRGKIFNRWEIGAKNLAAGESTQISGRSDSYPETNYSVHLPPIQAEGNVTSQKVKSKPQRLYMIDRNITDTNNSNTINIKNKIKELKMPSKSRSSAYNLNSSTRRPPSKSGSPGSTSQDEWRLCDIAERSCEGLCVELLRRLRSSAWYEISEIMDSVPKLLERFWSVIAENRIADLIRQINVHVESPRTQVARSACYTLAAVLKNTNYTKKPDFYEAMTILLTKTGSFTKPIRRAANVALDEIVCGVDSTHAVTALCLHGAGHKSALVRCASARLLVVCCALAAGGRELLRARPPTAACARRQALRSLATLLEDKNTDTRKYAERLYSMLRPLPSFEAYYLTDVDVALATRQMKKYDQLIQCKSTNIG